MFEPYWTESCEGWTSATRRQARKQRLIPILCSYCNRQAQVIDGHFPWHDDGNRCARHPAPRKKSRRHRQRADAMAAKLRETLLAKLAGRTVGEEMERRAFIGVIEGLPRAMWLRGEPMRDASAVDLRGTP